MRPEDLTGIPIIESPWLPEGRTYLVPTGSMADTLLSGSFAWREDPCGPAPWGFTDTAKTERRKALDHLARLLDGWCESVGADPDRTWRNPRIAERRAKDDRLRWVMDERVALSVINPRARMVVTDV